MDYAYHTDKPDCVNAQQVFWSISKFLEYLPSAVVDYKLASAIQYGLCEVAMFYMVPLWIGDFFLSQIDDPN